MNRSRVAILTLLAFAVAGFALAQNADKNTAGPTKNDYRLRVVQPAEGATITGDKLQVIVDLEIPAERDVKHDSDSMPHPDVDVFVDDTLHGTMRDDRNVIDVANLVPGPHTLVLLAKNRSGEVIDRKVIHVSTVAPKPAAAPVAEHRVAPPAHKPAPAPAYAPPPPPAPAIEAEPLPRTGSSDPYLVLAGFVLIAVGLVTRRLSRRTA